MAAPIIDADQNLDPDPAGELDVESLLEVKNHVQDHDPNLIGPNNPRPGPPPQARGPITKPVPLT